LDLTPLRRHRDYRLLYAAQFVSFIGTMLSYVALPYQMYQLTGSSLAVGLLGLAELIPLCVTAFVGGALADSVDRRRMVIRTDVILALGSSALAVTAFTGHATPALLYALAAVQSGVSGLQRPSLDAMLPRLVDREELPAAAALSGLRGSIGMIAGPAFGGILIATFGVAATYTIDALTYLFALIAIAAIRRPVSPEASERPSLESLREGIRYARGRQELLGTYFVDFVAMVFGMPLALFPAIAQSYAGSAGDPTRAAKAAGLLYSAPAIGALVASLTARWTKSIHRHGLAVAIAATVWGLAIVVFGLVKALPLAVLFLALAGGADAVSGMFRMTMWNQTIPDALRGRMAGIEMLSYMSGPLLGHVEAGVVAGAFGVQASVISGGVLCVLGVAVCGALLPRFLSYDARRA
jgi:MFS family permease